MGVVFGKIDFVEELKDNVYDFLKNYCESNNIELADDYSEDRLIATRSIDELVVVEPSGKEIPSQGNQISGMDSEGFEIYLEGIGSSLFEELFPHHVKEYYSRF
ncbi:MAG: hypothetical protein BM557_10585 [Flavobacterium sp. MedPE-SWcel]|uniref:hypothetical protein n=1 Tax=uncultured Flavobacterium sp. TaxID=165435 RepID=UPI0009214EB2|nr:hypothetical protein [uncultured Flavobacterium sp.]OIQ15994.1 MAG: hypothetical protein BM557_10585 [Flavobacterium sp. MedPE-SWcel]